MAIEQLPIFCYYNKQRFTQYGSMDCANWYAISVPDTKKTQALYPAMGRKHINFLNQNRLIFNEEPRNIFKSINYFYVVVGTQVFAYDGFYNRHFLGDVALGTKLYWAFLPVNKVVYAILTDEHNIWAITESGGSVTNITMAKVTDPNAPGGSSTGGNPLYVAAFGNRFVVSAKNTPNFYLSTINFLAGTTLNTCFTISSAPLFASATGIINQFAVLHSQLYIMNDYTTDIWANIPTQITVGGVTTEFPWKINSSYNWDYGIADPESLDVDFGRMVWLGKNQNGLVSFMTSNGQTPQDMSSQAINVLLENSAEASTGLSPFIEFSADGFLYQYENTIFYRVSAGKYSDTELLDQQSNASSLEYNFSTGTWARVIELNGERNRIQHHIYYNNLHLVTVQGDPVIYEMAGNIYHNETRNKAVPPQDPKAFNKFPMRYELITQQIFQDDYSEFIDDYVQIDFVFGDSTFYKSNTPFDNTVFIVDEESTPESPVYVVAEDGVTFVIDELGNTPEFDDQIYYALYKPHIELYISDDGGVTFLSADVREFSQLGQYRWLMRWNELGTSRNRCYKLVCVSSAPIVILGAVRNTRRASGGAN